MLDKGIRVIMTQRKENKEHPVLYLSKKFTDLGKDIAEKECVGIIFLIQNLRYFLDCQKCVTKKNHNPLVRLKTNARNNPRLTCWALTLQLFNYQHVDLGRTYFTLTV